MCEMMHENDDDKETQMEHILSENMRMLPDKSDEVDKYGPYLSVNADDWDELHISEHQSFLDANSVVAQFKKQMENHIKKHQVQMKEKERMGLKTNKIEDNSDEGEMYTD